MRFGAVFKLHFYQKVKKPDAIAKISNKFINLHKLLQKDINPFPTKARFSNPNLLTKKIRDYIEKDLQVNKFKIRIRTFKDRGLP